MLPTNTQYEKYLDHVIKNSKKIIKKCGLPPGTIFVFIQVHSEQDKIVRHSDRVVEYFTDYEYGPRQGHTLIGVVGHNGFVYKSYQAMITVSVGRYKEGLVVID